MRSEGRNLDLFQHAPARMLKAAEEALETAKIDPQFWGVVRQDRVNHYEKEVERWRATCESTLSNTKKVISGERIARG